MFCLKMFAIIYIRILKLKFKNNSLAITALTLVLKDA